MTGRIPEFGSLSISKFKEVHEKGNSLSSFYKCLPDPFPSDISEPISFSSFYNTSNYSFHRWVFKSENGYNQNYLVPPGVTSLKMSIIGAGGRGFNGTEWHSGAGGAGADPIVSTIKTNPSYENIDISLGYGKNTSKTIISSASASIIAQPGENANISTPGSGTYSGGEGSIINSNGTIIQAYSVAAGPGAGTITTSLLPYWMKFGQYRVGAAGGGSSYSKGGSSSIEYVSNGQYGGGGAGGYSGGNIYNLKMTPISKLSVNGINSNSKQTFIIQNLHKMYNIELKSPNKNKFSSFRVTSYGSGSFIPSDLLQKCVERNKSDSYFIINSSGKTGVGAASTTYDSGWINAASKRINTHQLPSNITNASSTIMVEVIGSWGGTGSNASLSVHNQILKPKKVAFLPQYWNYGYWNESWWWGYDLWYNRQNSDWAWWGYWGNYGYWDGYAYGYWNTYGWWDYNSVYRQIDNYDNWDVSQFLNADTNSSYFHNGQFHYYNWWWGNSWSYNWSWFWNGSSWVNKIPVISAQNYSEFSENTGLNHFYLSYWNTFWFGGNNWYNDIAQNAGIIWISPTLDGFKSLPAGKYLVLGGSYNNYNYGSWWGNDGYNWNLWYTPQHYPFIVSGGDYEEIIVLNEGGNKMLPSGHTLYSVDNDPAAYISGQDGTIGGDGVAFIREFIYEKPGTWYLTVPQDQPTLDVTICGEGGTTINRTLSGLVNGQEIAIIVGDSDNKMSAVDSSYNGVQDSNFVENGGVTANSAKVVIKTKNVDFNTIKVAK